MTRQEYTSLVNQANRASFEYYVLSAPTLSDADFDALLAQIEETERQHPDWILPDSPTQCVGSDLSGNGRRTVRHRVPMLSCQKAQETDAVSAWLNKTIKAIGHDHFSLSVEWKYDGISCSLVYQDGTLISAATRGDGSKGQDITAHARYIAGIPQQLSGTQKFGRIEVRGEILCPTDNLSKMGCVYTDCRTAASALCNMAAPSPDCALLRFIPWSVDAPCYDLNGSHYETISFAKWSLGFDLNLPDVFGANWPEGIMQQLAMMETNRHRLAFPVDGIVIKVDDKSLAASLGSTAHHPHASIAYKFGAQKVVTTCTGIDITTGKSGRRTPVAHFTPVTILGREVSKASLYSEAHAAKLGITPGSTIEVGLSHDITPKVYRVISPAKNHSTASAFGGSLAEEGSVCGDSIATPSAESEDVPIVYPEYTDEEIHARMLVATGQTSLDYETVLANLRKEKAEQEATAPEGSPSDASNGHSLGSAPVEKEATSPDTRLALSALSVLAIIVLFPFVLALTAFGFPVLNGTFK